MKKKMYCFLSFGENNAQMVRKHMFLIDSRILFVGEGQLSLCTWFTFLPINFTHKHINRSKCQKHYTKNNCLYTRDAFVIFHPFRILPLNGIWFCYGIKQKIVDWKYIVNQKTLVLYNKHCSIVQSSVWRRK